ncbi:5-formyltetrahydrofolate cyclo-ligase [Bradyrhizobium sp. LM4.3]
MSNSKAELRAKALAARDALSEKKRTAAAAKLARRGLPFQLLPGSIVSGYSPIRSEIDPMPLMKKLVEEGARLALPCVTARGQSLIFRIFHPNDRLMLGPLGIPEPSPGAAEVIPDIMLTPLAAFDRLGHRIGYGAGHTTTTLSRICEKPTTSSLSGSLLQRRRSRRFRHYPTTSRWIMC